MKVLNTLRTARTLKDDPFGFLIDSLIRIITNLFLPIPLSGELLVQLRTPVLGILFGIVALGLFLIITIGTLLLSPFFIPASFIQSLLPGNQITNNSEFAQTSISTQSPLGGIGLQYSTVTAGFMDSQYYLKFGRNHTGIDLVPNSNYYKESSVYKENNKIIVFATHTGAAKYYTDSEGGETVEITNNDQTLKTIYIHFKSVYAKTGDVIKAGQALGQMGSTGISTGEHVHYEIRIKDGNTWLAVNPLSYIK